MLSIPLIYRGAEEELKNKTILAISGLRGGVGATSMAALLAEALSQKGASVLVVDLNDSDLLRFHYDVSGHQLAGWGSTFWHGGNWFNQLVFIDENIWLLPYGSQVRNRAPINAHTINSIVEIIIKTARKGIIPFQPDWIIFDMPHHQGVIKKALHWCDLHFLVCEVDFAANILLEQYDFFDHGYLLLNKFNPQHPLGSRLFHSWGQEYAQRMLPVHFLWDINILESLSRGHTVLRHAPDCESSKRVYKLAQWCLNYRASTVI